MRVHRRLIAVPLLLLAFALTLDASRVETKPSYVEKVAFTMSTVARIRAYGQNATAADAAVREVERIDAVFDRFDASSDIGRLNDAGGAWIDVHPETLDLVSEALSWADRTDGAFDPTVAPLIDLWGFVEGDNATAGDIGPTPIVGRKPPSQTDIEATLLKVGYDGVVVDQKGIRLRLQRSGAQMDLGGIVKGYAGDRAVTVLKEHGIQRGLVDLGGDLFALGTRPDGSPWRIGVTHPRQPGEIIAIVDVKDQAIVTSGDYERYFEYNGTRYTHLLDPRTGYPARDLISATIVASTGRSADALATGVFALGKERAVALIEGLSGVDGILIDSDLNVTVTSGLQGNVALRDIP